MEELTGGKEKTTYDFSRYVQKIKNYLEEHTGKKRFRPPIGIMPHSIWLINRKNEIMEAKRRYLAAGIKIPDEWITELKQMERDIKKMQKKTRWKHFLIYMMKLE